MAAITSDIVDYRRKLDILTTYLAFYTNEELESLFDCTKLTDILDNFEYAEIKARLANFRNNAQESDVQIGSIVTVKKPYLTNGSYSYLDGVVIGFRTVYTDVNRREYYRIFDILVRLSDSQNNYRYDVMHEVVSDLIVSENVIEKVEDVIREYNRYMLEIPV